MVFLKVTTTWKDLLLRIKDLTQKNDMIWGHSAWVLSQQNYMIWDTRLFDILISLKSMEL